MPTWIGPFREVIRQSEIWFNSMRTNECIISKTFRFEASHILPKHPGKCARLHGHSWVLNVAIRGTISQDTGFVADYADLKQLVNTHIISLCDHQHLGQGFAVAQRTESDSLFEQPFAPPFGTDFYPSSENLVLAFVRILQPLIQELPGRPTLYEVSLDETCTSRATWHVGE